MTINLVNLTDFLNFILKLRILFNIKVLHMKVSGIPKWEQILLYLAFSGINRSLW